MKLNITGNLDPNIILERIIKYAFITPFKYLPFFTSSTSASDFDIMRKSVCRNICM